MNRRLPALMLRLYPPAFRRRYQMELLALLEESRPRPRDVLDLGRAALVAQIRVLSGDGLTGARERLRARVGWMLAGWALVVIAGLGYAKTTEDPGFAVAGRAHPLLGTAHLSVEILAWSTTGILALTVVLNRRRLSLRAVRWLSALAGAGMVAIAAATALYAVTLALDAGGLGAQSNGPGGVLGSVELSLALQAAAMALGATAACVSLLAGRAASARRG